MATRPSDRAAQLADELAKKLAKHPEDREAYAALHAHYTKLGDFASLTNLVAGLAGYSRDGTLAGQAYCEAAELAQDKLCDLERAERYYTEALAKDPKNVRASEQLCALLAQAGRGSEVVALLEHELSQLEAAGAAAVDRALVHYRLGEVLATQLERTDEALEQYRAAYQLDSQQLPAMYQARKLHLQRGDVREAGQLYEREASVESDPQRRAALLRELCELYQDVSDVDIAVAGLERAHAAVPSEVQVTHALASALVRRSANQDERTRALDLDRVADLLCDVAGSLEPEQGQAFLTSALAQAPWHARALYELERVTPSADRASLAPHWVAYLAHNPDGDLAAERRVSLARAYLAAGQVADAIFTLEPAAKSGELEASALLAQLRMPEQDAQAAEPPTIARDASLDSARAAMASDRRADADQAPAEARREHAAADATRAPDSPEVEAAAVAPEPSALELAEADLFEVDAKALRSGHRPDSTPQAYGSIDAAPAQPKAAGAREADGDEDDRQAGAEPSAPAQTEPSAAQDEPPPLSAADREALLARMHSAAATGDEAQAALAAQAVLEHEPSEPAAFELADRYHRRKRDFRARAALLYASGVDRTQADGLRKQRLRDAIGLYEQKLLDPEGALQCYRALVEFAEQPDDALRGMARLLERMARWDELCACLERLLALQPEPSQRLSTMRRIAELHRRERHDRAAAAETLARIIELDPHDRAARLALTEDWTALERWPQLVALLERRIDEAAGKSERIALLRQLAQVHERSRGDLDAAYAIYERVLELAPDDHAALSRMEEIDEETGAHERLLTTLTRRAQRASPAQAANLYVRMATIAEADLLDQARAYEYLRQALSHAPNNGQILTALANLCERCERYPELLELLRERAPHERAGKARAELQRRIARVCRDKLQDAPAAAQAYAAINQHGDDLEAWTFLAEYARAQGDDERLCDALQKLADLDPEPATRKLALLERAQLLTALERGNEAVDPLTRVLLELDPQDEQARQRLFALCESLSDYRPFARVLEELLARSEQAPARAELARALSDLYADKLPDDTREAKALVAWSQAQPDEPEPWRRLEPIYKRRRRDRELLETYDALARLEPEAFARSAALLAGAELAGNRLKDADSALARIAAFLLASRDPLPASCVEIARKADRLAQLCTACEQAARYDELCPLLQERIDKTTQAELKAQLYQQLAATLIEHREDENGALAAYEGLLSLRDDIDALHFVQAWAIRHDDDERLAGALLRLAGCEPNPRERRDLWLERGRLLRGRLERPAQAIAAFEQALQLDPQCWPALDELIASAEAAQDYAQLANGLARKLDAEVTQDDPVALLRRLAAVCEDNLRDDARTIAALTRWAALDSEAAEPLRRLRKQYERAGRLPELLTTLDALAEREREPAERTAAVVSAAQLCDARLNDSEGAMRRLLPLLPQADPQADRALLEIAGRAGRLTEVYAALEGAGRYPDLAQQLELAAQRETDPGARAQYLRRAARVAHAHLNDADRAAAAYDALLHLEEDAPALRFMQARALEAGDSRALADVLLRLSKLEHDRAELCDLLFEYAHILHTRLHDPQAAIGVLQRILQELDPEFEPALDGLIGAAEAADDPGALAFGLSRTLDREADPVRRAELAERLSDLYETRLNAPDATRAALNAWIECDPQDLAPRRRLRNHLQQRADHAALLQCLDEIALRTNNREERSEAALAAAKLCLSSLQDLDQAFARLSALALAGDVQAEDLLHRLSFEHGKLDALCELYERSERYDDLCAVLQQRVELETDPDTRCELLLRCARLSSDTLGDEFAAAEAYREVLLVREQSEALSFLRDVARRQDDPEALDDLLARSIALCPEADRDALLLERALLLHERLDRTREAIGLLVALVSEPERRERSLLERAIEVLQQTAEALDDPSALARALEARMALQPPEQRRDLALRLADLYEGPLAQPGDAARVLREACTADPRHLDARTRLLPYLEQQGAWSEQLEVLDACAQLQTTPAARRDTQLQAARCAHERLDDPKGALARLAPLVLEGDAQAQALADAICEPAGLGRELSNLYIVRARDAATPGDAQQSWQRVMEITEHWLDAPAEAFEASLRLLAADPRNRDWLDAVDRLALSVGATGRLTQVYTKLVRAAASDAERIELWLRLSELLETRASDASNALELALTAARLAPHDASLVERVARLARAQDSHGELLWALEQQAAFAPTPQAAIDALIGAARVADGGLHDREQANTYLRRALSLTREAPEQSQAIERTAAELDTARPELGPQDAQRALLRAHLELCEQSPREFRVALVLRAARLSHETLNDDAASFDVLRAGAAHAQYDEAVLDALEASAVRIGRLDALDAQLARSVERATDPEQVRRLLMRRGRLLQQRLMRYELAAQVYERVLELSPDDARVSDLWLECLRSAGRPRELLRACERRLEQLAEPAAKLPLMREMARIWEADLKNRPCAAAIWHDIRVMSPGDAEADHALQRLNGHR